MTEHTNLSATAKDAEKAPHFFIDRKKIRRERTAARAAALEAAQQDKKSSARKLTLSVSLSNQQQEGIRREAEQMFRTLSRHPECTREKDGRLRLIGPRSVAAILGDNRVKLDPSALISKIRIQEVLRDALLRSLRHRKRQLFGKPAYEPKTEQKTGPKLTPKALTKVKKPKEEPPRRDDPRRQRRIERRAPEVHADFDIQHILTQASEFEAQGDWRRAANILLQTGDERVQHLERIGTNYMRAELYPELIANLGPYCGMRGVSAAVSVMVGQCRLKMRQFDKASRVVEPVLNDSSWGSKARDIAATALLEQERPWLALELLEKPTSRMQEELRLAAQLSVALLSEDTEQAVAVLSRTKPERLLRETGQWYLQLDLPEGELGTSHIKLAPASVAKAVTLTSAMLELNQPELALTQIFNSFRIATPETGRDMQVFIQIHTLKARTHFECAGLAPDPQEQINLAFQSCAVALRKRPTDKELLLLAAKITDGSADPYHQASLAAILEASRNVPVDIKGTANDHEPVAAELDKAFARQAEVRIEREPHLPSRGSRRAGGFNYVR